jgi:quercetin dioxygenase-like cupin family protein
MKHATYDELNATEARSGVTRRVFSGEGATLAWTTLEPGHTPRPHAHHFEQVVYIVQGTVRFAVGEEQLLMKAGDMVVIPPNVEHCAETVGDEPVVDLSVFTPKRHEYAAEERVP